MRTGSGGADRGRGQATIFTASMLKGGTSSSLLQRESSLFQMHLGLPSSHGREPRHSHMTAHPVRNPRDSTQMSTGPASQMAGSGGPADPLWACHEASEWLLLGGFLHGSTASSYVWCFLRG